MKENTYNGWTNYCTWVAALWLNNEETTYKYFRGLAAEIKQEEADEKARKYQLENAIKEFIEENAPELSASMYSDLLGFAMQEINYYEIASNILEE